MPPTALATIELIVDAQPIAATAASALVARCLDMAIIPTYGYLYPYVDIFDDVCITLEFFLRQLNQ
ncbi:protein of unknown function [Georgfuchsia toluolica]|uniref:Uncharacterized protein n=1 Tax=Georgfuchsia toluolica TaxID=424218 RepID=A0A916J7A3_9PROT|nr:protein of unknown function [Georgfuchsia toluolica]